ncbi:MAG: dCMP deaminase family protein [Nitrososphaerota archaeon]|nr:dCMP deaminase family protein [Nitrososphaerota archaeon]MDG6978220.1 dCMP deaminase family protein [Nitrososphaerota archaeon]MDG7006524.1 dCMP deaminase family protein [Nitrososphaerota archaeon]MDG7020517.1 dCMP deaminase family protein [Nitrososphaerota archaeon]MDG7021948.1 dCMP deaminase family protein [Nitrososphaerota archaeon]
MPGSPARPPRPSWDEYFMQVASVVKTRSTCLSSAKGAVLVLDRQIVSTGYNGTPAGTKNCNEGGCARCLAVREGKIKSGEDLGSCSCSHCEENAIVQAAKNGIATSGATIYSTHSPCTICSKMIINAGIKRVVAATSYPDQLGVRLMKEAGLELVMLSSSASG